MILNIIHVITTIELGGAEKQLLILARNQRKFGHRVTIFYLKGKPELRDAFEKLGVPCRHLEVGPDGQSFCSRHID